MKKFGMIGLVLCAIVALWTKTAAAEVPLPWWNVAPGDKVKGDTVTLTQGDTMLMVTYTDRNVDCASFKDKFTYPSDLSGAQVTCDNQSTPHNTGLAKIRVTWDQPTSISGLRFAYAGSAKDLNVVVNPVALTPETGVTRPEYNTNREQDRADAGDGNLGRKQHGIVAASYAIAVNREDTMGFTFDVAGAPWGYRVKPRRVFNVSGEFGARLRFMNTHVEADTFGLSSIPEQSRMFSFGGDLTAGLVLDLRWVQFVPTVGLGLMGHATNDEIVGTWDVVGRPPVKIDEGTVIGSPLLEAMFKFRVFPGTRVFSINGEIGIYGSEEIALAGTGMERKFRGLGSAGIGAAVLIP